MKSSSHSEMFYEKKYAVLKFCSESEFKNSSETEILEHVYIFLKTGELATVN